jgi:hypothetical protein
MDAGTKRRYAGRTQCLLLAALLVAGIAATVLGREATSEAAEPSIVVDMAPGTPGVQSSTSYSADTLEITVNVVAQDVSSIGAFEFGLAIPFGLQFASYAPGPLLGSTGRVPSCLLTPKNPEGRAYIACATAGPTPAGASGTGVLATLRFRVLVPLDVCLHFFLVDVANIEGIPQSTSDQGGCATVVTAPAPSPTVPRLTGDVDGDCIVTVMDFTLIARRFGYSFGSLLYVPAYDLNHNGSIDIFDLQLAAGHFTQHC